MAELEHMFQDESGDCLRKVPEIKLDGLVNLEKNVEKHQGQETTTHTHKLGKKTSHNFIGNSCQ